MIIRAPKDNHCFTKIARVCLQDQRLSWKARGLLAYLLSKPDDWNIQGRELLHASDHDKKSSVQSGMAELVKYGYAKLIVKRGARGRVEGREYIIAEIPDVLCNREQENLSVGDDREQENLSIGERQQNGHVHREPDFPTIGKTDDRKTCPITYEREDLQRKDLPSPIILPPAPNGRTYIAAHVQPSRQQQLEHDAAEVLAYLNVTRGRTFASLGEIPGCLKRGATREQCFLVIDWWQEVYTVHNPNQTYYFNHTTPFRKTNFDKYRAEAEAWSRAGKPAHLVSFTSRAEQLEQKNLQNTKRFVEMTNGISAEAGLWTPPRPTSRGVQDRIKAPHAARLLAGP